MNDMQAKSSFLIFIHLCTTSTATITITSSLRSLTSAPISTLPFASALAGSVSIVSSMNNMVATTMTMSLAITVTSTTIRMDPDTTIFRRNSTWSSHRRTNDGRVCFRLGYP
eukprot:504733_1